MPIPRRRRIMHHSAADISGNKLQVFVEGDVGFGAKVATGNTHSTAWNCNFSRTKHTSWLDACGNENRRKLGKRNRGKEEKKTGCSCLCIRNWCPTKRRISSLNVFDNKWKHQLSYYIEIPTLSSSTIPPLSKIKSKKRNGRGSRGTYNNISGVTKLPIT